MSKADSDKHDGDDVLRAQDIVSPYSKKIQQNRDLQKMETDDVSVEGADLAQKKGKIPKFDLAEQILAEQRKIAAMRRKAPPKAGPVRDSKDLVPRDKGSDGPGMLEAGVAGPGKKVGAPSGVSGVQSIKYTVQPPPMLSEQEQIIAEIVARDIEQMCGGFDA